MESSDVASRWRARLEVSATILLIVVTLLVGGFALWDRLAPTPPPPPTSPPPPSDPVSIDGAPIRGDRNAKVALIEFSDFECPFCGRSARDVLPAIDREYLRTGKVLLVWRNFPLPFHRHAQKAAEAAECAGRQGKFWEFHDWAFEHQQELDEPNLRAAATGLGLDPTVFATCLDGEATATVEADVALGTSLSVSGTPTWFIGVVLPDSTVKVTDRVSGAMPLAVFQGAIDRVLAAVDESIE